MHAYQKLPVSSFPSRNNLIITCSLSLNLILEPKRPVHKSKLVTKVDGISQYRV